MSYILALDLSTKSSGAAIYKDTKLIKYECFTASSRDVVKRIQTIIPGIKSLLEEYPIETIVLEQPLPDGIKGKNPQTHRALMWIQAAVVFTAHDISSKTNFEFYYPSEWRAACGIRNGRGITRDKEKQYDIDFVKKEFNLDVNDDIADAIGIGYAYTNKLNNEINWE